MRLHVVAAAALVFVVSTAGVVMVAVPADASGSQTPANFDDHDAAFVAQLMGEGIGEGAALFLADTKVDGNAAGRRGARMNESFPTGNNAVITVSVAPSKAGVPDLPTVKSASSKGGDFTFSIEYFVPYDTIPVAAQTTLRAAVADRAAPSIVLTGYSPVPAGSSDASGVDVLVQGLVKKYVSSQVGDYVKYLDGKLGTAGALDGLLKALKAGLSVRDALALSAELDALKAQIDALEECAKHPTNPLTKKAYESNPQEQKRILDQVEATRAEVAGNSAVSFLGLLNSTASGLIKGVPWLGYVIGPGTSWSKDTLRKVNQERIKDLKNAIVPCDVDLKVDAVVGTAAHITGVKCGGPAGAWDLAYTSAAFLGEGHITFTLDRDSLSGPYSSAGPSASGRVESSNSGTASYAGAPDGKSGTLTMSQGGSVPVTGGVFCTNGVAPGG